MASDTGKTTTMLEWRLLLTCKLTLLASFSEERLELSCRSINRSQSSCDSFVTFSHQAITAPKDEGGDSNLGFPVDPLKWFGLLTPPALKTCQTRFKDAVSSIPSLATVTSNMKELDIEIRRTRKKLRKVS